MKSFLEKIRKKYRDIVYIIQNPPEDRKKRYRKILLFVSVLCIIDYLAFSYLAHNNVFDIFPSIPVIDTRDQVNVYLPDLQTDRMLKETRLIKRSDDMSVQVRQLVKTVARGSKYENTSVIVPVDLHIRKVWLEGDSCIIDFELSRIAGNSPVIDGSEKAFLTAVNKTISENIKSITRVVFLENGIPGKRMWELSESAYY